MVTGKIMDSSNFDVILTPDGNYKDCEGFYISGTNLIELLKLPFKVTIEYNKEFVCSNIDDLFLANIFYENHILALNVNLNWSNSKIMPIENFTTEFHSLRNKLIEAQKEYERKKYSIGINLNV
jgi:hypothetical protein